MGQTISILELVVISLVTIVLYALIKTLFQTSDRNADENLKN